MLRRGVLRIDVADAAEIMRAAPRAPTDPEGELRHLARFHLLALSSPEAVEFVHPLIQEFYAAEHLRGAGALPIPRTLIREYVNSTLWTEPLRLFAEECDEPATATHLVDATRDVDAILAARLVGSFPALLQPVLLARLHAADDTPGTRLTRAFAVGTDAVSDELQQLAAYPDPEVRFHVADVCGASCSRGPPRSTTGCLSIHLCRSSTRRRKTSAGTPRRTRCCSLLWRARTCGRRRRHTLCRSWSGGCRTRSRRLPRRRASTCRRSTLRGGRPRARTATRAY